MAFRHGRVCLHAMCLRTGNYTLPGLAVTLLCAVLIFSEICNSLRLVQTYPIVQQQCTRQFRMFSPTACAWYLCNHQARVVQAGVQLFLWVGLLSHMQRRAARAVRLVLH